MRGRAGQAPTEYLMIAGLLTVIGISVLTYMFVPLREIMGDVGDCVRTDDCGEVEGAAGRGPGVAPPARPPGPVVLPIAPLPVGTTNVCAGQPNGSTPFDADKCCFDGEMVDKFGQKMGSGGIFGDGTLAKKCPDRVGIIEPGAPVPGGLRHEIDGCSAPKLKAESQDPMRAIWGDKLLNVRGTSTAFGQDLGGEVRNADAAGDLPCNQHDICYQTCHKEDSGGAFEAVGRDACDDAMKKAMDEVCEKAFPDPSPARLTVSQRLLYHLQRHDCFGYSTTYWGFLRGGGADAYAERQTQYCKCCA